MVIGRTEDRNTPGNPLGRKPRRDVWGPIRVTHLGPRSTRPHTEAGHMTAIDQTHPSCKKTLRGGGRPHMGFLAPLFDSIERPRTGAIFQFLFCDEPTE